MKFLELSRDAFLIYTTVALLTGCESQPPIGAPPTSDIRSSALANQVPISHAEVDRSSPMRDAKKGDLLYVVGRQLYFFTYPQGRLVGTLASGGSGICSDRTGNVFVVTSLGEKILEYAHRGTSPIATLSSDGYSLLTCSVDPMTGNLAVTYSGGASHSGGVVIYQQAQGTPQAYVDPNIFYYYYCAYDNQGNLFVDGENLSGTYEFAELPKGSISFTDITIDKNLVYGPLEWHGSYLTLANQETNAIYRLRVEGSTAMVVGTTKLRGWRTHRDTAPWIQDHTVFAANGPLARRVGFWPYPAGGTKTKSLSGFGSREYLMGMTISVGSPR